MSLITSTTSTTQTSHATPTSSVSCVSRRRHRNSFTIMVIMGLIVAGCSKVELPATAIESPTATTSTSEPAPQTTATEPPATSTTTVPTSAPPTSDPVQEPPAQELLGELQLAVVNSLPHDAGAFTQGLAFENGEIIESLGIYGESEVLRYVVGSSTPLVSSKLTDELFGGGLTLVDGLVVQLTWRGGQAIIRDGSTLEEINSFTYEGEGWGICDDGSQLLMSDGSSTLTLRDRTTFEEIGSVSVTRDGQPVSKLNELECVDGFVWANVWLSNEILRINTTTGEVVAWVDASALVPSDLGADDVLNGIAFSSTTDTFYLTGKRWPELYEVVFSSAGSAGS